MYFKNLKVKIHLNKILVFVLIVVLFVAITFDLSGLIRVRAYTSPSKPDLTTADSFAILAGSTVVDSNTSVIDGNVGLSPAAGSFYVALTAGEVSGTIYAVDVAGPAGSVNNASLLISAKDALTAAYIAAAGSAPDATLAPLDLGGLEFAPGVYNSGSSIAITGTTTLNAGGDPNAIFIFQAGSTLTTISNSHVNLINGAQACNVFWQVGTSATLGTYSDFKGNILALDSITDAGHSTIIGRLLARNAAVTLDYTNLTKATCAAAAVNPTLTITKTVNNTHGGTKTTANFSYFIDGIATSLDVASTTSVGSHVVSESADSGYAATFSCDGVATSTIVLALNDVKTCTITNNDIAPQLTVTKFVNNNHGGTKAIANFPLFIDGQSVTSGVASTTTAGLHTISETADSGYTSVISGDCSSTGTINLALGSVKSCTITNNDIDPATSVLTVTKFVNNNHGGTKVIANFPLFVDGHSVTSGVATTTSAGLHTISETSDSGYTSVIGGDCSSTGTVNISSGGTASCTITNSDIAPQLTVTKFVVGGTKIPINFPLFVDGSSVTSGIASTTSAGSHTISETSDSGYTSVIGGDCSSTGTINLALGATKLCTITNSYIVPPSGGGGGSGYIPPVPPIIDVVKVPSPLALPGGAGPVTYKYTLRNIGIVPVTNITMIDDSCSSVSYISGDANNDSKLDINETWTYKCSTIVSKTHTNIVVATGWANGLSATDIANATVVVGASIIPPLIHVTKIPSPLALGSKGGVITYTETITNPGAVALSNVNLTDDKCSPVEYISGDTNGDSKLDISETWTYTCRANITQTTTNVATASGWTNGLMAKDFAFVTVVVAPVRMVPGLPKTGVVPEGENFLWYIIMSVSIVTLIVVSSIVVLRKSS